MPDPTEGLLALFTQVRPVRKAGRLKYNNVIQQRINTVTTLQNLINHNAGGSDLVAPIRARACHALHAVLRTGARRPVPGPRLMEPGMERC